MPARTIELSGEVYGHFQGYTRGTSDKLQLSGHIRYTFDEDFTTLTVNIPHFNGVETKDVLSSLKNAAVIKSPRTWRMKAARDARDDDDDASSLDDSENDPYTRIIFKRRVRRP